MTKRAEGAETARREETLHGNGQSWWRCPDLNLAAQGAVQRLSAGKALVSNHIRLRAAEVDYLLTPLLRGQQYTSTEQSSRQLGTRLPLLIKFDSNYSVVEVKKEESRGWAERGPSRIWREKLQSVWWRAEFPTPS